MSGSVIRAVETSTQPVGASQPATTNTNASTNAPAQPVMSKKARKAAAAAAAAAAASSQSSVVAVAASSSSSDLTSNTTQHTQSSSSNNNKGKSKSSQPSNPPRASRTSTGNSSHPNVNVRSQSPHLRSSATPLLTNDNTNNTANRNIHTSSSSALLQQPLIPLPLPTPPAPFVFHSPPSLFRSHRAHPPRVPVPNANVGLSHPINALAPVQFPQAYTPVNLVRFLRRCSPCFPFSTSASSTAAPPAHSHDYTLSQLWAFYDNPYGHEFHLVLDPAQLVNPTASIHRNDEEGTEVYFVPYLSALVLFEPQSAESVTAGAPPPPPLLQWYERVSPSQRMPVMDQISSIASCFSPPPSSPLYQSFAPFPSKRILFDLRTAALDLSRSWFAVTWYPILHDPLTTPLLSGSFLTYHSFAFNSDSICPLQESEFSCAGTRREPSVSPDTPHSASRQSISPPTSSHSSASPAPPISAPLLARDNSMDRSRGGMDDASISGSGADVDVESDTEAAARLRRTQGATKMLSVFPSHVCAYCGDRHGPIYQQSPMLTSNNGSNTHPPVSMPTPQKIHPFYLSLLGYMCHRVLPSTWFVHALLPKERERDKDGAIIKQQLLQTPAQAHQLEFMAHFNSLLNHPASFSALSLANQPVKFTNADLTAEMYKVLQQQQHPDFLHLCSQSTESIPARKM